MAVLQTARQVWCHESGKKKNCETWAAWEPNGSSPTAALCHGGTYDRDVFEPCPSRSACYQATAALTEPDDGKRHLPVQQTRPSMNGYQASPQFPPRAVPANAQYRPPYTQPTTMPTQVARPQYEAQYPQPVMPPPEFPAAMRTPYAAGAPVYSGGISPTFLPGDNDSNLERLVMNAAQGAISAVGWHIFDFSRAVDLFGRR